MSRFLILLSVLSCLLLSACESNSDIGAILQPENDKLAVKSDTFLLGTSMEVLKNRYSESDKLVLGRYDDATYGSFNVDFISEFRYVQDDVPANAVGKGTHVVLYYKSYFGDSLSQQEASVYALSKSIDYEHNLTADFDLAEYCDKSVLLGTKQFTAKDPTVPDSVMQESDYCHVLKIPMPKTLEQTLLTNTTIRQSQEAFNAQLKGAYVTISSGTGTVLQIDSVNLECAYSYAPDLAKPDSLIDVTRIYPVNKETTAAVRVSDLSLQDFSAVPDSVMYIATPYGVAIRMQMPFDRMIKRMVEDNDIKQTNININNASLVITKAAVKYDGALTPPNVLLLIREKDIETFFTQSLYPAPGINTVLAVYDEENGYYSCGNFAQYLEPIIRGEEDFDTVNDFFLIPVSGTTDTKGTYAVLKNLYRPSAIPIRSPRNTTSPFRLAVSYTIY